jgi:hypothetical protein
MAGTVAGSSLDISGTESHAVVEFRGVMLVLKVG